MVLAISAPFMARTELMAWISSAAAKKEQAARRSWQKKGPKTDNESFWLWKR